MLTALLGCLGFPEKKMWQQITSQPLKQQSSARGALIRLLYKTAGDKELCQTL